jgi:hypothetical protein
MQIGGDDKRYDLTRLFAALTIANLTMYEDEDEDGDDAKPEGAEAEDETKGTPPRLSYLD